MLNEVAAALARSRHTVALTGAGISAESGIATFRSAQATMGALWKDFDPRTLATPEAFAERPERVQRWYDWRRIGCLNAEPNAGHTGQAELERRAVARGATFTLLTQNVDRLHQRAGSCNVIELHGDILQWRCGICGQGVALPKDALTSFPLRPACHPRSFLRPNVVWFGEMLPDAAVHAAESAVAAADCFLTIGTSSVVYPAAGFVHTARALGACTIEVNPEATPATRAVDHAIAQSAGTALPAILALMPKRP